MKLRQAGVLGIIRIEVAKDLLRIAHALHKGGVKCLEITMPPPGALRAIEEASSKIDGVLMGWN